MIIKVCICIPVYNSEGVVEKVIADCLKQSPYPVLVVDDGSKTPVEELLKENLFVEALESGRLTLHRHNQNQGKGVAIKTAIDECARRGFTHILTMDGDGQHLVSEVEKMMSAMKTHPWSLIIGARKFKEDVPEVSKFGRKFSNFWVDYQTGFHIQDSQSGLRIYPLFFVQNFKFWTKRYDFEIEILIKSLWKGVHVFEVPVEVYYPPGDKRLSHFDKLWDNVRISLLNTLLVILSLLRTHTGPVKGSLAFGLGILIGSTPLFGFHSFIAAITSFVGRLNFGIIWLGTQISIPPLIPFIVGGSVVIGHYLLGEPLPTDWAQLGFDKTSGELLAWGLGSLALGSFLGLIGACLWYLAFQKIKREKNKKKNWQGKLRGGKFGNGFLKFVLKNLGLKSGYFCLHFIIPYFYIFAPKSRKALNEYWQIRRPDISWFSRQVKVVGHLYKFAKVLMDKTFAAHSDQLIFDIQSTGIENIKSVMAEDCPLILLTAHIGSWDLGASNIHKRNISKKIYILEYFDPKNSSEKMFGQNQRKKVIPLPVQKDGKMILALHGVLSENQSLALMGDRATDDHFELVPFFDKLVPIPVTPFRLAMATDANLVFTFGLKGESNKYYFYAEKPFKLTINPGDNKMIKAREAAISFVKSLEGYLKENPDQWFNFYPFWSSLPTSISGGVCKPSKYYLIEELNKPRKMGIASASAQQPSDATELQN